MAELKPIDKVTAAQLRDFADWASEDTDDRVQLRALLDAYVYKCNNRLAVHRDGHVRYFPRDSQTLPVGWKWTYERTCGPENE